SIKESVCRDFSYSQNLISRSVESIGPGATRSIDYCSITAELGTVRIRQCLKFRNRFDTERRSEASGAWAVVPEIDHILIVQQVSLPRWTRSGDRILLSVSIERIARARSTQWDLRHTRRQRHKVSEIPAIQRKVRNLLALDQCGDSRRLRFHQRHISCYEHCLS